MIRIADEKAMLEFGVRMGTLLGGGECIELIGDVGAGKTTLTRGIAEGLAIDETIQSPSFTISRVYEARDGLQLAHYDFYRLDDAGIMADELDEVIHDEKAVIVIEWADVAADVLPDDRLTVRITTTVDGSRSVVMSAGGDKSSCLLKELA